MGYGILRVGKRMRKATHCQFKIRIGDWPPKGKIITHKVCCNPPCQNHRHLRLGTRQSNMNDMVQDGHSTKGERAVNAKLTEKDVRQIKRLLVRGELLQREIGKRLGVKQPIISHIKTGKRWAHVMPHAEVM